MAQAATAVKGGRKVKAVEAPVDTVQDYVDDELADLEVDPNADVEQAIPDAVAVGDESGYDSLASDAAGAMSDEELVDDLGEALEDEDQESKVPLIRGARVVYMGAKRNKSVAMVGRIIDEPVFSDTEFEMVRDPDQPDHFVPRLDAQNLPVPKRIGVIKTCGRENGTQSYDFSTHDARKRPIMSHRMPQVLGLGEVAGKRFIIVEHPDHLLFFQRSKDESGTREFRIFVPRKYRPIYRDYVLERDAAAGRQKAIQKYVTA